MKNRMIYYLCPDDPSPVGGVKQIYRHVSILEEAGLDALAVHHTKGFRPDWFNSGARSIHISEFKFKIDDWAVIPETCGLEISNMCRPANVVIYNQNAYYTFLDYPRDASTVETPYLDERVKAVITNSRDGKEYLEHAFGRSVYVYLIPCGIPGVFSFQVEKRKNIAFMPRKNPDDLNQVINILRFRGLLNGWRLCSIDGVKEEEVARILKESSVFLSSGAPEGFGLPPAEAIACGCVVVGYHGQGGREFMSLGLPSVQPVEVGDILQFARNVEAAVRGFNRLGDRYLSRSRRKASGRIRKHSSMEKEAEAVLCFWREMLSADLN